MCLMGGNNDPCSRGGYRFNFGEFFNFSEEMV